MTLTLSYKGPRPGTQPQARFRVQAAVVAWADEAAPLVLTRMRRRAPASKGKGGGALKKSLRSRRFTRMGELQVEFGSPLAYARFIRDGTPPHLIRAHGKALRWTDSSGEHFARYVRHPGTQANPFARQALLSMKPALRASLTKAVQDATRRA